MARVADRLIISYPDGDVDVPPMSPDELAEFEAQLSERTATALQKTQATPPRARPGPDACRYCSVRQLCDEYWTWIGQETEATEASPFGDLEITLSTQHGPRSWDASANSCRGIAPGQQLLLRCTDLLIKPHPGDHLRVLNAHVSIPEEDFGDDGPTLPILTVGSQTEVFLAG